MEPSFFKLTLKVINTLLPQHQIYNDWEVQHTRLCQMDRQTSWNQYSIISFTTLLYGRGVWLSTQTIINFSGLHNLHFLVHWSFCSGHPGFWLWHPSYFLFRSAARLLQMLPTLFSKPKDLCLGKPFKNTTELMHLFLLSYSWLL